MSEVTLLSTAVVPRFEAGTLRVEPVDLADLPAILRRVTRNLCGHPATNDVLKTLCPTLPVPERGFWDGTGVAVAVRPRGGVRGGHQSDVAVTVDDLEAAVVKWMPDVPGDLQLVCAR